MSRYKQRSLSRRHLGLLLAATALVRPARAAVPADVPGWGATRWGMSGDEVARALGAQRVHLAAPLEYNHLIVRDTIPGLRVANRPFVALLQLDPKTERLAQVLLRYRGDFPMLSDFVAVRDLLARDYGAPQHRRAETYDEASFPSFWIEAGWTFPSTEIVVSLTDPNADPWSQKRKTLVVRYSPRFPN